MEQLDSKVIEAGTVVQFGGFPVMLAENTRVFCNKANFDADMIVFIVPKAPEIVCTEKVGE